jgi:hypothetical protein
VRTRTLVICIALLLNCKAERPAPPSAATQRSDPSSTQRLDHRNAGSLAGDTLELISIGDRQVPEWHGVPLPCDSAHTPLVSRMIFTDDSTYREYTVARPGCRDERYSSSDTTESASIYRVHGDTLMIFSGDGDEIDQSYNGRLFPDSVVQLFIEAERVQRYARRRARGHDGT